MIVSHFPSTTDITIPPHLQVSRCAEVCKLAAAMAVDENILTLDVSVNNALVEVAACQCARQQQAGAHKLRSRGVVWPDPSWQEILIPFYHPCLAQFLHYFVHIS